jgi:hypothetical protein
MMLNYDRKDWRCGSSGKAHEFKPLSHKKFLNYDRKAIGGT